MVKPTEPYWCPYLCCHDCGSAAGKAWTVSTWHMGTCPICKETAPVTETRDYGYPNFLKRQKEIQDAKAKD